MTKEQFDLKYSGEKVVVHCDTEEKAKAFLSLAKSFGTIWASGEKIDETLRDESYEETMCYSISKDGRMRYADLDFLKSRGYKIVEFELDEPNGYAIEDTPSPMKFKVGDVVYVSEYGQDSQTYTIVGFENMAIIKNNRGGQKLESLSNLTHTKRLKKITEKELADMGYMLVK